MADSGMAGSEHYTIKAYDDAPGFQLAGVTLRSGAYELIEAQLHLLRHSADEGVAARYTYQLEGVLLLLLRYEELSAAGAESLRRHIHEQLPTTLAAMVSAP